ncbi:MAG TPA: HlyD family efflux transporter periplasmic adaptor subunit [Pirellulaceae bacterium]|nr:HlyD family efflux transporter periplasmic adaptor subunit [Pirellulaceae bacterium]
MTTLAITLLALAAPPLVSATPAPGKQVQLAHCLVSLLADVQVPAREAGALTAVEVTEGQLVTQGQLLARLDDRQPQLDKLAAELQRDAALAKAQDDIEVRFAVAAQAVAAAELERSLAIERRSPGGVTQQEIQKLQLARHRDELQIERSRLEMRVAKMNADVHQASVQSAEDAVARRQIVSPLDGVVVALLHERGEWVAAGEAVVQVVRVDRLRVEGLLSTAEYSPEEIAKRPVTVDVPLAGGRVGRFAGQIVFISPLVAAGNTYRVRAEVENRVEAGQPLLRPGMTATMTIDVGTVHAVGIPR